MHEDEAILVLSGVTKSREEGERHPYRAARIVDLIVDLLPEIEPGPG